MARVPSLFLKREDYKEVSDQWMDKLLRPLNTFGKQVQDALNKGLTFGENSQAFVKTITFTDPGFPIKFRNELNGGRPIGVLLLSAIDVTSGSGSPVSLGQPAWSISSDQVQISDMSGIVSAHKYRVTFLVLGG